MSQETDGQTGRSDSASAERPGVVEAMFEWLRLQQAKQDAELKRERFWRNVRTTLIAFGLVSGPLYLWYLDRQHGRHPIGDHYVAMVRVSGIIGPDNMANAERISMGLERAFEDRKALGVVVLINSPGGSPVQSSIIHDKLTRLRARHPGKKVWAVGEDMMTSGAYFVAMGAPKVCVNRSTLTGSIGVIRDGWGLDKVIDRFGIERRVFTAGGSKNRLDTFKPLTAEDQRKAQELLSAVHEHFKMVVRSGRGTRLKGDEASLFSGDFWTGDEALRLGLVDRLCDVNEILAEEYGVTDAKDYTPPPSFVSSLASAIGAKVAESFTLQPTFNVRLLPP